MNPRAIAAFVCLAVLAAPILAQSGPSFRPRITFEGGGESPKRLALGDFNHDRELDIAMTDRGSDSGPGDVVVLLNDGGASGFADATFGLAYHPWAIAAADFDGDQCDELAVGGSPFFGETVLLRLYDSACTPDFELAGSLAAGGFHVDAAADDFDGDGDPDLAVLNNIPSGLMILRNTGGTLAPAQPMLPCNSGEAVDTGDLTGDGRPDLACATYNGVSLYRNDGAGVFAYAGGVNGSALMSGVAIADMDGDGNGDVVSVELYGSRVLVTRGRGDGTFFPSDSYTPALAMPHDLAAGDLDRDGRADIFVSDLDASRVVILMNNGDGTLADPILLATHPQPVGLAAGDLDGDGWPDLAVGSANAGLGSVVDVFLQQPPECPADLTGDGLIDFSDYLEFLNLYDASDLRIDFTGDGLVDFADYLEFLNLYDAGC